MGWPWSLSVRMFHLPVGMLLCLSGSNCGKSMCQSWAWRPSGPYECRSSPMVRVWEIQFTMRSQRSRGSPQFVWSCNWYLSEGKEVFFICAKGVAQQREAKPKETFKSLCGLITGLSMFGHVLLGCSDVDPISLLRTEIYFSWGRLFFSLSCFRCFSWEQALTVAGELKQEQEHGLTKIRSPTLFSNIYHGAKPILPTPLKNWTCCGDCCPEVILSFFPRLPRSLSLSLSLSLKQKKTLNDTRGLASRWGNGLGKTTGWVASTQSRSLCAAQVTLVISLNPLRTPQPLPLPGGRGGVTVDCISYTESLRLYGCMSAVSVGHTARWWAPESWVPPRCGGQPHEAGVYCS